MSEEKQGLEEEKKPSVEEEAAKRGWKPPEQAIENGVSPEDAIDAKTFMDREPFIKQIKLLNQRNNTLSQKLDNILDKFNVAETQGYERAIVELQRERDTAYDDLDSKRVREIDNLIDRQKEELNQVRNQQQQQAQADIIPEAADFVRNNQEWWRKDIAATEFAMSAEAALKRQDPNMDFQSLYDEVQRRVDVFRGVDSAGTNRKTSYVAAPTRASGGGGQDVKYSFNDLTNDAKDVYKSMQQYRKDTFNEDYTVEKFVETQLGTGAVELDELVRK